MTDLVHMKKCKNEQPFTTHVQFNEYRENISVQIITHPIKHLGDAAEKFLLAQFLAKFSVPIAGTKLQSL